MKLIDEREVKEAAKEMAATRSTENEFQFVLDTEAFSRGSNFAEQKLLPMMVEFAEWCGIDYIKLHGVWCSRYLSQTNKENWRTTEQLLEQFLKNRTK